MESTVTEQTNKVKPSMLQVLETCQELKIPARMVGRWCWIKFESKPSAEIRTALKEMGFRWIRKRSQWANSFGRPSRAALSYRPWDKYSTVSLDDSLASRRAVAI